MSYNCMHLKCIVELTHEVRRHLADHRTDPPTATDRTCSAGVFQSWTSPVRSAGSSV